MSHDIIDGRAYAQTIQADVRSRVAVLRESGWQPRLVSITVGNNPAAALYVRNQGRACKQVGIEFESRSYSGEISQIYLYKLRA